MIKKSAIIWLALLLMTVVGCRSHRQLTSQQPTANSQQPTVSEPEKPKLDTILNATYSRYSANFSCTVEGISVNGQIRMVHDSCIWISISKIIEVGRIMITPTRVSGYARIVDKYFDGTFDEVCRRWGIDIDYATVEALLVGNCPPNCRRSKEPESDGNQVTLWYNQNGNKRKDVTIKKGFSSKLINSTEITQAAPSTQLRCTYSDRTSCNGQMMPATIDAVVTLNGTKKQTRLKLSRITLNKQQNTPFSIPSNLDKL